MSDPLINPGPNRLARLTVANRETDARTASIHQQKEPLAMPTMKPLVSGKLALVATVLAPVLFFAAPMMPPPINGMAFILAFVAAALAGLALPAPSFTAGKPLIPLALVPICAALVPILVQVANGLTGHAQTAVFFVALVLSWLAGLAAPPPLVPAPVLPVATPVAPAVAPGPQP